MIFLTLQLSDSKSGKEDNCPVSSNCNSILYIHPSTMKSLQILKGDHILVQTSEGQLILKCWSCSENQASFATLHSSVFSYYAESTIAVEPLQDLLDGAEEVYLCPQVHRTFMNSPEFHSFLERELSQIYIRKHLKILITYLGYSVYFAVTKITTKCDEAHTTMDDKQDVEKQLKFICARLRDISLDNHSLDKSSNSLNNSSFLQDVKVRQTSTPISSRKTSSKTKKESVSGGGSEDFLNLPIQQKFYFLHPKTKIILQKSEAESPEYVCFDDLFGLAEQITDIKSSIDNLLQPGYDLLQALPRGIILVGQPGAGKSMIGKALKNEYSFPVYLIGHHEIKSFEDKDTWKLEKLFKDADICSPSVIYFDDFDQLFTKDEVLQKEKTFLKNIYSLIYKALNYSNILVIATVQNENLLPSHLRKRGFFEKEVHLSTPSSTVRKQIFLKFFLKMTHNLKENEIEEIVEKTDGFTCGKIHNLCQKTKESLLQRSSTKISDCGITLNDLKKTLQQIKPASVEFNLDVPNVKWKDIGGMHKVKEAVTEMVDWPLRLAKQFKRFKITPSRGILMYGPPGCCKTMIAKAVVTESNFNFISVKGSDLFNKYVGESERSVSALFKKARSSAPCVLFFDEIDSITSTRGSTSGNSNVCDRVLTQLLIEIDGIDVLNGVCILAATNRPDMIDPSFLRPGRFDHMIYVPLPDQQTRLEIFKVKIQKMPVSSDVDLSYLTHATEGYSGAEITDLCQEAAKSALKEDLTSTTSLVSMHHFIRALQVVLPRTTEETKQFFENYECRMKNA